VPKGVRIFTLSVILATAVLAQNSALNGTVTDPSGAVVPNASIVVTNQGTGANRATVSDAQGHYEFDQLPPGQYKIDARASGFAAVAIADIRLQVNEPATILVKFEKTGAITETIQVEATATQVNTVDASLGNVIGSQTITEVPMYARNVAALLALQPGVTSFGSFGSGSLDDRSGSVNGGRSDQSNITLDGVDVLQETNRAAFTSVLRVTPDSVEEFRVTTTNGGADTGRGSGADIALITKTGTNQYHGSMYEYRRGTETAANTFFNNRIGVPIAPLLINIFGGSVGGPIKKNKLFFFLNYEGRRDASSTSVTETVPMESMKQGMVNYHNTSGQLITIGPAQIQSLDPGGIGIDPAALAVMKLYPVGNNNSGGDQVNTTGYTFNAPVHNIQNTYIARLDYKIDDAGKHSLFFRGNLQNDSQNGTPQFPGDIPNSVTLSNSKGDAMGYIAILSPTMVNTLRYGETRAGNQTTGVLNSNYTLFRGISGIYGTSTGLTQIVPVHTITDDLSWNKNRHDIKVGGVVRFVSVQSTSFANSYDNALTNASTLKGSGNDLISSALALSSGDKTSFEYAMTALLGLVSQATANYNNNVDGTLLPPGAPIVRDFVNTEGEMYAQDSWRVKNNLTVTYGLRYSLMPPVHEAHGEQVSTNIPVGTWFNERGALAAQGESQMGAGTISFLPANSPGGRPIYPYHKNPAPRLSIAYSPKAEDGVSRFLFGGAGKTSIRAGAGIYYDEIGQPLAASYSSDAFGLSTSLSNPANALTSAQVPRFTGFYSIPSGILPAAPAVSFPPGGKTYPDAFAITNDIDDALKAPYTVNLDFSIGRQFGHGLFIQGSYVGRLSRHSLVQRDLAMPTDLVDTKSGQTYYQAMSQLATLLDFQHVPLANLPKIPFFEDLWSMAAGNGNTATQVIARDYLENSNPGDFTNVLNDMNDGQVCNPNGSTFLSNGNVNQVGCGNLGPYSIWSPQFSALSAWSSIGKGSYNAMQWTVQKQFSQGLSFTANYTFSKSEDLGSTAESSGSFGNDFIINSWNPNQLWGVSRYDTTHAVNAYMVYQLPVGRGRRFGSSMSKPLDAIIGGWETSGTFRITSGLPFSASDGSRWATNWQLSSFATPSGVPLPPIVSTANGGAVSGTGGPNLWANPTAALNSFEETLAGQTGSRDAMRGSGFFNIDSGLYKNFSMPWSEKQKLQFRWESYNVTNSVRFDPASASLSLTSTANFGKLTRQLGTPRQMQFALRYTF
jgi:hypothetical protein